MAAAALALGLLSAAGSSRAADTEAPWPLDALSAALRANADERGEAELVPTLDSFANKLAPHLLEDTPGWLSRAHYQVGTGSESHPWLRAGALEPLANGPAGSLLMQGHLVRQIGGSAAQAADSLGLGIRRLLGEGRWLVGANGFVDGSWASGPDRGSLGGELGTTAFGLRLNLYEPGGAAEAEGGRHVIDTPGYDMSLRLQLPYLPSAMASFENAAWRAGELEPAPDTRRFGLSFRPLPFLSLDGQVARSGDQPPSYTVGVRMSFKLDDAPRPATVPLIDDRPFRFADMAGHVLDMVKRDGTTAGREAGLAR